MRASTVPRIGKLLDAMSAKRREHDKRDELVLAEAGNEAVDDWTVNKLAMHLGETQAG